MEFSFGDIVKSKAWLSVEFRRNVGWCASLGKTYGGTKAGIVLSLGCVVIIGHIR